MSEERIKKAIQNANSNVSIEDMENETKDLRLIKEALKESKDTRSFLYNLVKLFEKDEKKGEKNRGKK